MYHSLNFFVSTGLDMRIGTKVGIGVETNFPKQFLSCNVSIGLTSETSSLQSFKTDITELVFNTNGLRFELLKSFDKTFKLTLMSKLEFLELELMLELEHPRPVDAP